jgi:hypothetical protein
MGSNGHTSLVIPGLNGSPGVQLDETPEVLAALRVLHRAGLLAWDSRQGSRLRLTRALRWSEVKAEVDTD